MIMLGMGWCFNSLLYVHGVLIILLIDFVFHTKYCTPVSEVLITLGIQFRQTGRFHPGTGKIILLEVIISISRGGPI